MGRQDLSEGQVKKLFSPWMLLLCIFGLAVNLLLSKLVIFFGLPLYIDNVGSILVGALGGTLPGMTVGFLSNFLGSVSEPISLYYGILTILIAWLAALFSQKGLLKKCSGWLMASGCFVLIGGAVGSIMTWFLYGGGIGGIAEPYARFLNAHGLPEFFSQLTADILLDIPDKLITVGIVCLLLHFYPKTLRGKFPLSSLYDGSVSVNVCDGTGEIFRSRHSVNRRFVFIVAAAVAAVGLTSLAVGTYYHQQRMLETCDYIAQSVSGQAALCVDGDAVAMQMAQGEAAPGYAQSEARLREVFEKAPTIQYLYVYAIKPSGCYVVYDIDVPGEPGRDPGILVEDDPDLLAHMDEFLAGGDVAPIYSSDKYGTLVSAYTPIRNSHGVATAYACADVDMKLYVQNLLIYVIQVMSLMFAVALLAIFFTLWYVNRHITEPIQMIVDQTQALGQISPEKWLESSIWVNRVPVQTDDELEELYQAVTLAEENASINVKKRIETEQELLQTKELERVNRQLEVMIKKADDANRAKTDFLSRMSHDIRTPLNAIIGTAFLAKDEVNDPAAMKESLTTISSAGEFLLGLINDILDINKIENGKIELRPEPFPVTEFIHAVEKTIRPLAEKKNIEFIFEMGCGHGLILADKLRYKQIFFNLLSNAIKYTPAGGRVEFAAEALDAPPGIAGIRNYVRDTGIGMTEEYLQRIYEPFTRDSNAAVNNTEGSGLGLAIVKSLVDSMGGTIRVKSELGHGTEFMVDLYLPLAISNAQTDGSSTGNADVSGTGCRLLLVEDNAVNMRIAERLLEKKGYLVTKAGDGLKALELFENSPVGWFRLILMDIRMPGMNGLEAAEKIRALNRKDAQTVKIAAMTANAYVEDEKLSLSAGMNAHLAKPIDPEELYAVLARLLQQ